MAEEIKTEMTEEELHILTSISVNEEKVRSGHLNEWQTQLLKEIRALKAYLSEKYPSSVFTVKECTETSTADSFSSFLFTEASHEGILFNASCYPDQETGEITEIMDNYYRVYLEEPLKKALEEALSVKGLEASEIRCSYTSVLGKEADENITLELAEEKKLAVQPTIQISFEGTSLDEESAGKMIEQASEAVKGLSVSGFYVLHVDQGSEELKRISFAI